MHAKLLLLLLICLVCSCLILARSRAQRYATRKPKLSSKSRTKINQNIIEEDDEVDSEEQQESIEDFLEPTESIDPYFTLGKYLVSYDKKGLFEDYSLDEVSRAIKSLAAAHAAWKTMDGATHQFRNTFKESTSLQSRFDKFIAKKSKNTKEAVKLTEYITTVERGLQTAEILQSVKLIDETKRKLALHEAGLHEVGRYAIKKKKLNLIASVLQPLEPNNLNNIDEPSSSPTIPRFASNETIICLVENPELSEEHHLNELLRLVTFEKPISVPITNYATTPTPTPATTTSSFFFRRSNTPSQVKPEVNKDLPSKEMKVLPSVLHLAHEVLDAVTGHFVLPAPPEDSTEILTHNVTNVPASLQWKAGRIRVLGHSLGAAVGSYCTMLLDGLLNTTTIPSYPTNPAVHEMLQEKVYAQAVKAYGLSCFPCVSRDILVPQCITTLICGDDMISRVSQPALHSLQHRITSGLQSGAGKVGLTWFVSNAASVWKDVKTMAGKNMHSYRGRKQRNMNALSLPGRVMFIKSRQLKQGATIQRILRGNWQEEVLWSVYEVLLSKKMIEHHTVDAYIRTLNRC